MGGKYTSAKFLPGFRSFLYCYSVTLAKVHRGTNLLAIWVMEYFRMLWGVRVCERQPLGALTGSSPAHGQESSAPKLLWLSARKIFLQCICYGSARGPSGVATQRLSVQGKLSVVSSMWMEIWVGGGS